MDDKLAAYIDAIPAQHRPLFDRLQTLILDKHPGAEVVLSYNIPAYKVGSRRLFVGVWKHGLSLYGWGADRDAGFLTRHPELKTSKGTIKLTPEAAADISDRDLVELVGTALDP
ncbi:MAG: DUF1801 domain-containing protein [Candidatus Dormibacteraeota bacterium]|nr:DUF1801 domain-containing protein [Candidatus Dormibacteraeota bacterium]